MLVEGDPKNCKGCHFLDYIKGNSTDEKTPFCWRFGDISNIKVCPTGRMVQIPRTREEWEQLLQILPPTEGFRVVLIPTETNGIKPRLASPVDTGQKIEPILND